MGLKLKCRALRSKKKFLPEESSAVGFFFDIQKKYLTEDSRKVAFWECKT